MPNPDTPELEKRIDDSLAVLYSAAWVEGSNWNENNPEGSQIPSKREIKKTAAAKQALLAAIADSLEKELEGIIGASQLAIFNGSNDYETVKMVGANDLRVEQRQRAAEYIEKLRGTR